MKHRYDRPNPAYIRKVASRKLFAMQPANRNVTVDGRTVEIDNERLEA